MTKLDSDLPDAGQYSLRGPVTDGRLDHHEDLILPIMQSFDRRFDHTGLEFANRDRPGCRDSSSCRYFGDVDQGVDNFQHYVWNQPIILCQRLQPKSIQCERGRLA